MSSILVIGDSCTDIFVYGKTDRICPEAPVPVFNPTHLFGLLSVFTPDIISKLDMYQANIPSKYGGRISSVMDIKVKNPYSEKLELNGGIGLLSSRLKITTPILKDKLLMTTAIRGGFTDFLFPMFVKRLKNTKANFYDGTMKLLYIINDNNQFSYNYFISNDFYQLDLISNIERLILNLISMILELQIILLNGYIILKTIQLLNLFM